MRGPRPVRGAGRRLLLRPGPQWAEPCRRNRPHSIVECTALVPFGFQGDRVGMRYCNLMSVVKGAMNSEAEELEHVRKGAAVQRVEVRELDVTAATLTSVLDKYGFGAIDF